MEVVSLYSSYAWGVVYKMPMLGGDIYSWREVSVLGGGEKVCEVALVARLNIYSVGGWQEVVVLGRTAVVAPTALSR